MLCCVHLLVPLGVDCGRRFQAAEGVSDAVQNEGEAGTEGEAKEGAGQDGESKDAESKPSDAAVGATGLPAPGAYDYSAYGGYGEASPVVPPMSTISVFLLASRKVITCQSSGVVVVYR